jgi:predicted AAA+ superfamily ATPase
MHYHRYLEAALARRASRGKARLVLGARQTGKSTLFQLIRRPADLVVDLQERSERLRLATDPAALGRALAADGRKKRHVLIDEVQRVPELLDEIQLLLDRHPGRFTFTLTGSSARRLRRGAVNLLPGRIHRFHLSPVCNWEVAGLPAGAVLPRPRGAFTPEFPGRSLEDMLVLGNLPAAWTEGREFAATLGSYAAVYVEEEVLREMAARSLGNYGRFLQLAAVESGKPINLTKLSQESGIALSTIRGFYSVLEDTLLAFVVEPFGRSERARILKTPKAFFFDVGVRNALAGLPLQQGILSTQAGQLFEHWVACELTARIAYLGRGYRLGFWRTVDGAEVDFVLQTPHECVAIEAKYTANPRPTDASAIEHFIERHRPVCRRGFVVCRARRREQLSEHVTAIPWQEL